MPNLIEGIQREQNRVRELIPLYVEIGPAGAIGAALMRAAVDQGDKAIASGDVLKMLRAYKDLEECTD